MMERLRLGFACKIIDEGDNINIRSLIKRRLTTENLMNLVAYNIEVLHRQFEFLEHNNIKLFRMCSDIIPFGSSTEIPFSWEKTFANDFLKLGQHAKKLNLRLSMHPGQYTVLNSENPAVIDAALRDLNYHAALLDCMNMDETCKLVLHIGGVYGNKEEATARFLLNYQILSENVKKRLILENDHNRFNAMDVLKICSSCGCPMVFDLHHNQLNPCGISCREILLKANETWKKKDGVMKVHYSQSGLSNHMGVHSETIKKDGFTSILPLFNNLSADIMLEVKDKNRSVLHCQQWLKEWEEKIQIP